MQQHDSLADGYCQEIAEAVKICAATGASLNLNWSPWYYYFNCTECKNDPRVQGAPEDAEIALFTSYLTTAKTWVAAANRLHGSSVQIATVALDSEKFGFQNKKHNAIVGSNDSRGRHCMPFGAPSRSDAQ